MRATRHWIAALLILAAVLAGTFAPTRSLAQDKTPAAATQPDTPAGDLQRLLNVLEDDNSRAALIDQLRKAQTSAGTSVEDKIVEAIDPATTTPPENLSFSRRIAIITQDVSEDVATRATSLWTQLARAPQIFRGLTGNEAGVLLEALRQLAIIIAATIAVFVVLRRVGKSIYARMGAMARDSGILRRVLIFAASVVIDALIVVVAWATGYLIAIFLLGDVGAIGIRQTLYLNAFLLVEMANVAVRLALSPSARDLRPLPVADAGAKYLSSRLSLMVGLVGYGQLLIVPIINTNVSFAGGRAVSAIISLIVVALAIGIVVRNRRAVADWLERGGQPEAQHAEELRFAEQAARDKELLAADTASETPDQITGAAEEFPMGSDADPVPEPEPETASDHRHGPLHFLTRQWHWFALAYLVSMLVLVLAKPNAAFHSLMTSGQVLIVALVGITLSGMLTRTMVRGIQLPDNINARLPLLEMRLNTFVPRALLVLRLLIFVVVVAVALNAISLIDLHAGLASQIGIELTRIVFSVVGVLIFSFLIWVALSSWVDYRLNPDFGSVPTARERTLLTLLRNAATIALLVITLMFVLSEIGINIAPLLASAGVFGLAIGFGAKNLVQDVITGIFIQLENALNVGDVVTASGTTGVVERLTIRSLSLRDLYGTYHLIPFSSVEMVSNYMREFAYSVCDMGVAYREDIGEVKQAMQDAFDKLRADPEQAPSILGDLEWFGVNSFGDSAVVVRTRIKCRPGDQWGLGRAYNGILKEVFDERGIEIPFPHQTLFLGESKSGETQAFRVRMEGGSDDTGTT